MEYTELGINVSNFIDSYRNIGYTMQTAIADIIDNSIFAGASKININFIPNDSYWGGPVVQIIDNGNGMSDSELRESMRLACRSPLEARASNDLGRYGLGLKSASFSQCRLVTVCSKKDGVLSCKQWDLDHVKSVNRFEISELLPSECNCENIIDSDSGTAVVWTKLDSIANIFEIADSQKKNRALDQLMDSVYNHIAITYSSYFGQIEFYFNDNLIELWDPFAIDNPKTTEIADERIEMTYGAVRVRSYILPTKQTAQEMEKLSFNSTMNELQGFYVYRNNRLIKYGTWLGLKNMTKKEAYRLARIRIDIDNTMDELWKIDIKKENASCPSDLSDKLMAYAKDARSESQKVFRSKGKTLRRGNKDSRYTFLWDYKMKNNRESYEINRDNPIIQEFIDTLDDEQETKFKDILKCIENYIPIMSILEVESKSGGKFIENTPSELSEADLKKLFASTVVWYETQLKYSHEQAIEAARSGEPFSNHVELLTTFIEEMQND